MRPVWHVKFIVAKRTRSDSVLRAGTMKFNILQGKKGESASLCGRQKYALDEIKDFKFQSPQTIPTATMTMSDPAARLLALERRSNLDASKFMRNCEPRLRSKRFAGMQWRRVVQVLGHSLLGPHEGTGTETRLIWPSVWMCILSPIFPCQRRFSSLGLVVSVEMGRW